MRNTCGYGKFFMGKKRDPREYTSGDLNVEL
jgi:hypothetical protein